MNLMYVDASKLEGFCQSLTLPEEQGRVNRFLTIPENAQRINTLVEDIFDALMEYQVYTLNYSLPTMSDTCTRLHCNKISMMRVADSLWVSLSYLSSQTN